MLKGGWGVSSTVDDQMTYGGGEVAPTGGQG
jgi:hypothetical protein